MAMTPEEFKAKREARIARLLAASERIEREGQADQARAHQMAMLIPFGQPILIGHHSEKRDRAYRDRIHSTYARGFEKMDQARELAARAEAAQNNTAISSDDPEAIDQLKAKVEKLEAHQEHMKAVNKLVRKNDRAGLEAMGLTPSQVARLFVPDFCGRLGYPDYEIKNNNANIRRIKERIEHLERHAKDESSESTIGDIRIFDNTDLNRLQMFFPGKPSESIRSLLKSRGFKWAPSEGAWQRFRSDWAMHEAREIAKKATGQK